MARRQRKYKAFALDPRITRCAEQAFNIEKDPKTGGYFLEYYIVNDRENIEKSPVFTALKRKDNLQHIVNGISAYQKNYQKKRNRGLKPKGSKTLKLMGHFDDKATLLATQISLSSRVEIYRLENENVTESFFGRKLLPTHKNSNVLSVAQEFSQKMGLKIKRSENLAQNIAFAASLITANIARGNNIPFLYPSPLGENNNPHKILKGVSLDHHQNKEKPLQAFADAPLREFRKAVNFIQLARLASYEDVLDKKTIEIAAQASNYRAAKLLENKQKDPRDIQIKKLGVNEQFVKNMDTVSLIFIHAQAEKTSKKLNPIYEKELNRRLLEDDIEENLIDATFIALNFIEKHKTMAPAIKNAQEILEKKTPFVKKGNSFQIN